MTINSVIEELEDLLFSVELRDLKPAGSMDPEESEVYNLVLHSETIEELPVPVTPYSSLAQYAIRGAVASGKLDKFKFVLHNSYPDTYVMEYLIIYMAREACRVGILENNLLVMVEYLVQLAIKATDNDRFNIDFDKGTVNSVVEEGFYKIGEYLLSYRSTIKALNTWDLFSSSEQNLFKSFKWLLNNGAEVEKTLIGEILCQKELCNMYKRKALDDHQNLKDTIDFLIDVGVTTKDKVIETKARCDLVVEAIQGFNKHHLIADQAKKGASVDTIQFLLDYDLPVNVVISEIVEFANLATIKLLINNGASLKEGKSIIASLINHPDTEVVQYLVDEMSAREVKIALSPFEYEYVAQFMCNTENCATNKIIADYIDLPGQVDWNCCDHIEL
ncbi:MAG: hypothetical protein HRU36_01705 [Rickettsiales bacterium]|nr:hypothetical protein [Rickettsiales bacterium]